MQVLSSFIIVSGFLLYKWAIGDLGLSGEMLAFGFIIMWSVLYNSFNIIDFVIDHAIRVVQEKRK